MKLTIGGMATGAAARSSTQCWADAILRAEGTVILDRVFINLTREQIATLLTGLSARLGGGLTQERARQFEGELEGLAADDDVILEETVLLGEAEMPFVLDVFGSEGEALEAGFLVPGAVARVVIEEAQRLFGSVPMRHMPAMPEG